MAEVTLVPIGRRKMAKADLEVPEFGFGAAHLGELLRRVDDAVATQAVERAWDVGIRYYDTAPLYGHGLSERRLGNVLRHKPRGEFVLSSKVGTFFRRPQDVANFNTDPWIGALPFQGTFDYSGAGILRSYEQSLLRLGINTLDALVIHNLDHQYHDEASFSAHWRDLAQTGFAALRELKARGEIKAIGAGVNTPNMIEPLCRAFELDFLLVAMPYTLLDQDALDHGLRLCEERQIGVVIGSPYASGVLAVGAGAGHYNYGPVPEAVQGKVSAIAAVCARHGVDLRSAALQFPLAHPAVVAVIPGMTSRAEVDGNVQAYAQPIPDALWADLKEAALLHLSAPTPALRSRISRP